MEITSSLKSARRAASLRVPLEYCTEQCPSIGGVPADNPVVVCRRGPEFHPACLSRRNDDIKPRSCPREVVTQLDEQLTATRPGPTVRLFRIVIENAEEITDLSS